MKSPESYFSKCIAGMMIVFFISSCTSETVLKDAFKNHFLIGAALGRNQVYQKDSIALDIVARQFNTITPENDMKWENIHPGPSEFVFDHADKFVRLGEAHDMFIVGHTLVWHSQTPDWVFQQDTATQVTREMLLKSMENHIKQVVGRYKGKVNGWDVVNEALKENGELRQSKWYNIIGEDYIEKAFEFASKADPQAELYYNDYNLYNPDKREGAIMIVKNLQEKGIRIDGVGMQAHYGIDGPDIKEVEESIIAFSELGVKVMITELDISVLPFPTRQQSAEVSLNFELQEELNPYAEGLPDSIQTKYDQRYLDLFRVFLKHSDKISRVTFWGVHDGHSWKNNWPVRGRTDYPLLFDRNYQPKEVVKTIVKEAKKNTKVL